MGITEIIFSITKAASKLIPSCRKKLNDKLLSASKVNMPLIIASSVYCTHRPSDDSSFDLVNLLLRFGLEREGAGRIRVDDRDNKGNTALIKASRNGAARIVKTLIQAHADVNAKNNEGFTALMRAEKHGYDDTGSILRDNGAH